MRDNRTVYIPEIGRFLYCAEGTGDNLLAEDIAEGYVDYVYIESYIYDGLGQMIEDNGGQLMLKKSFHETYKTEDEYIKASMELIYDKVFENYIVIKESDDLEKEDAA